jgi:glucose/arabinose dehydrogenase
MRRVAGGTTALAALVIVVACASAAPRAGALSARPFLRGLDSPVYVTSAPGSKNTLYVVEQPGRIRVAVNGTLRAQPLLDIRSKVRYGGEQGLLSVAFHPNYVRNHKFYVDYTDVNGDTRVVEYRSNSRRTRQLLFVDQPYPNHNGGQLQFGPDGWLYVGMGDGGSAGDPENRAQNLGTRLGKLLRINVNAKRPRVQIAAYGLRNPWRFSFDRSGNLYIGDVGQDSWEEIDYTPRNSPGVENYGWDAYEGTHVFENKQPNRAGHLVMPVAEYSHGDGCSVTGGYVFGGRYYYGDFCSGNVWSLRIAGGKATDVRREPFSIKNLSSWGLDRAGRLYATSLDGVVYRIS